MSDEDEATPERIAECRSQISECAAFLLPLAHASIKQSDGRWPMEVAAWLTMVRDSFLPRDDQPH